MQLNFICNKSVTVMPIFPLRTTRMQHSKRLISNSCSCVNGSFLSHLHYMQMPQGQPVDSLCKCVWQQTVLPGVQCPTYSGGSALAVPGSHPAAALCKASTDPPEGLLPRQSRHSPQHPKHSWLHPCL